MARESYWRRTAPDLVDGEAGLRILRRAQYRWHVLDDVRQQLGNEARAYWAAFEAVDAFLENCWHLLTHLALFRTVTPVTQLNSLQRSGDATVHELCMPAKPFDCRLGMVLAVPATVTPIPVCGVVRRKTMSFHPAFSVCCGLSALPDGWEVLLE